MITFDNLKTASDYIKGKINEIPDIAIVLGSGLSAFSDKLSNTVVIDYKDIPYFPCTHVEGHKGRLVYGRLSEKKVLVMQGRVHYYEGYTMDQVVMPVRAIGLMGIKNLILTNASGGIADELCPGDVMIIRDHISSYVPSPLIYPDFDKLGERFPDMSQVYDMKYIDILEKCMSECGLMPHKGVYIQVTGPQYETPAEIQMYKKLGSDAVGMSTVCEAVAAKHMGLRIAGLSVICNKAAGLGGCLSHKDIIKSGDTATQILFDVIMKFLQRI